jgi:hypothetical protein
MSKFLFAYLTVQQFVDKHAAFTVGGIRSLIFNEHSNGLAESGAIVRIGRKILIDEVKFFDWISSGQKPRPKTTPSQIKCAGGVR